MTRTNNMLLRCGKRSGTKIEHNIKKTKSNMFISNTMNNSDSKF